MIEKPLITILFFMKNLAYADKISDYVLNDIKKTHSIMDFQIVQNKWK